MTVSPEHPTAFLDEVDREAQDWAMRFAAGSADRAELEIFKRWSARDPAHAEAFARACRLWDSIEPASAILAAQREAKLPAPKRQIGLRPGRRAFIGGALAASAAAAAYVVIRPPLGLWPSLTELTADYRTGVGEQRNISLADGPSVGLNTRTSIALRPAAAGAERIELIAGEAVITAHRDMRRVVDVIAADGHATATDAIFNMRYEETTVCTTCVTGEIEVERRGRSARLRAGQQIIYSPNGFGMVTSVDLAVVTAWNNGMLVFHATPLSEAIAEINRYRSGRIILTNAALGRRLFNARFRIENIDGVVKQIQQIFDADVMELPGGLVLLG
jgi:transmembrane sensor